MSLPATAGRLQSEHDTELVTLVSVRDAAHRAYLEATSACADLEATPNDDPQATERLVIAQDRVVAARDRYEAAQDRFEAAQDRRRAAAYLQRSYRDDLTGVLQRQSGRIELQKEIDRARRLHTALVVVFVDVDGLKRINDIDGHLEGDRLLRSVGTALRLGLRSYDVVLRFGGDEFVCGLPGATIEDARRRMRDIGLRLDAFRPGATISAGLAELGPDDTIDDVIQRADADLYSRREHRRQHAASQSLPTARTES